MRSRGHGCSLRPWAAVPLRLIVGYGFMAHGYAKVMNGPARFAASETNLLYLAALATLVLGGSGPYAFDRLGIRRHPSRRRRSER
jgi:uncharacterized membrane protein YphA (DoxX/SURF4 family)